MTMLGPFEETVQKRGRRGWQQETRFGSCVYNKVLPRRINFPHRFAFSVLVLSIVTSDPLSAQANDSNVLPKPLSISTGTSVWSGDFGAPTNTQIISVLFGARYEFGGLRLVASIPRMQIRSDGSFFAGLGGTPLFVAPTVRSTDRVRDGFGDLTVGASYLLPHGEARGFDIDLSLRAKVPTASQRSQLSTGKFDYSVGVDVDKPVGRFTPAISAVYRIFGNNRNWHFRNGFDITAGSSFAVSHRALLVLNYEYVRAATHFIGDAHEIVLGGSSLVGRDRLRLTAYVSKGLSDGAAAVSGGASLSVKL